MDIADNSLKPRHGPTTFLSQRASMAFPCERNQTCVVHFIGRLVPGGAERRTLELIEAASSAEFRHVVCVTSGLLGTLDSNYGAAGAQIEYLKIKSILFPIRLIRLFRRYAVDVSHSNLAYSSGYVLFLAYVSGVPNRIAMFVSDRSSRRPGGLSRIQRYVMRFLIDRFSTQIVGLTPKSLELVWSPTWRIDPRCKVVPRGVPVPAGKGSIPEDLELFASDTIIVHAGRADLPTKNREKAISVFAAYNKLNPDSRLVFVGRDGKDTEQRDTNRRNWLQLVSQLGVSDRVHFLGEKEKVVDYLSYSDGFLFTSTLEGLPGVVLEALSAGLPVTSSSLPGTEFIDEHVRNVKLLDPFEPDATWATTLFEAVPGKLGDRSRERNMSEFAQSIFTLQAATERYSTLWRNRV